METDTSYTPPTILSEVDDDVIHERMLENLPADIDKTEGGFAHDFTRPAALEKAEMMIAINDAIQVFFPEWSYAGYLDKLASGVGLTRRSAQAAETELTITGAPGTIIPAGFLFATTATAIASNIEFETKEAVTIDEDGNATIPVQCTQTGPAGNVPANSIVLMSSPVGGVATITNPEPATGGVDDEDDDSLRERIKERDLNNESSFVGNDADYKRWAKEIDGVGTVIVVPEWQGPGTGTVKLIVMDANGAEANQTILTNVYDHIMSPDDRDRRLAPIGAILTVVTGSPVPLTIAATVTLEAGSDIAEVTASFEEALKTYYDEAQAEGNVRYTRIGSVLSETPGVLDYESLTVNGGTANIPITTDHYPTTQTVTLTEAT